MESQAYLREINVEAMFQYSSCDSLKRTLRDFLHDALERDSNIDHTVLITGFSPSLETFPYIDDDDPPITKAFKKLYFKDSKTLILTMASKRHERVAGRLCSLLELKLNNMGCWDEIDIVRSGLQTMGNIQKQPDGSWGPLGVSYATCILEVALSQSKRSLDNKARLWLESPGSHVSQVITIKLHTTRPELTFEVWVKPEQNKPEAKMKQHVEVTWEDGRPKAGNVLSISFEMLLERKPRPGTAETDIFFSARDLGGIARHAGME